MRITQPADVGPARWLSTPARKIDMAFLAEPEPERGVPTRVADGVLRLVARNPGQMTYHGTNTYLVEADDGFVVVDPGPATDVAHVEDILRATGGRVSAILLTHGHGDHLGALPALRGRTGATVHAFHHTHFPDFSPDVKVRDGERVLGFEAIHTPGHAPDHLCFARDDGLVFTGDHVMSFSSSVVSPPWGNMRAYVDSLQRLIERDDPLYLPGHGPPLASPRAYVEELKRRRVVREGEIVEALQDGLLTPFDLSRSLYAKLDPVLQDAAQRNVLTHLAKLEDEGRVRRRGEFWELATGEGANGAS